MKGSDSFKKFTKHDLRQLDKDVLLNMDEQTLQITAYRLLAQLKNAEDRLDQNSSNSSIPPSKNLPWSQASKEDENNSHDAEISGSVDEKTSTNDDPIDTDPHQNNNDDIAATNSNMSSNQSSNDTSSQKKSLENSQVAKDLVAT